MEKQEKCCDSQFKVLSNEDYKLPPLLQESIDKIVKKEGYITHKSFNRSISTSGGNYLAELYEVDIKGQTASGIKETNIFIKSKLEDAISVIDMGDAYNTETFFYEDLTKLYDNLQNKAKIPLEERYNMAKSFDALNPNAIILENLSKKGFTTFHRMEVVPLKFAELSIQQLARFHGLSWALEKKYPVFFEKHIKPLRTPVKFNDEYQSFVTTMANHAKKFVTEEKMKSFTKFVEDSTDRLRDIFGDKSKSGEISCLCHGDFRANNILAKIENGDVTEVIPVDFQLLHYGCPVTDLVYFIFPCTDREFRTKHLEDLKNLYFHSLAKFLNYFDIDVESVFPKKAFEALYKESLEYGLTMSLLITPILFTDDNDVPDFTKDFGTVTVTPDAKMEERLKELVEDFQSWGVL